MPDRNYYMIRAMLSREDDFKIFFDNNVVAVGWSKVDFASLPDSQEVKNAVRRSYYEKSDKAQQVISKNLNEVERFKDMKKGDYILVPFNSYIALAEANEKEIYSPEDYEQDLSNQSFASTSASYPSHFISSQTRFSSPIPPVWRFVFPFWIFSSKPAFSFFTSSCSISRIS